MLEKLKAIISLLVLAGDDVDVATTEFYRVVQKAFSLGKLFLKLDQQDPWDVVSDHGLVKDR